MVNIQGSIPPESPADLHMVCSGCFPAANRRAIPETDIATSLTQIKIFYPQ